MPTPSNTARVQKTTSSGDFVGFEALGKDTDYCFRKSRERILLQGVARELMPLNRALSCCGRPREAGEGVDLLQDGDGRAWYGGIFHCGSVWCCPVCAAKISGQRRKEVQTAIDNALAEGMGASLVTLTFRHGIDDQLAESMTKFAKALRRLKSGRAYVALQQAFGIHGEVRALEITHGVNGWHPHTHALTFSHTPMTGHTLTRYRRRLFVLWYKACQREGLPLPTYAHGVDVRGAKYVAEYMAKWGFASELVKSSQKQGRKGGRTPWQLLADAGAGDKRSAWLFREYAKHFKGRRQLFWSRGLRERLSLKDQITDQELLDLDITEPARVVARIDPDTWAVVRRAGAELEVLAALEVGGITQAFGLLNYLRATVPKWNGERLRPRPDWER